MGKLKKLLLGLFVLVAVIAVVVFTLENQQPVGLVLLGWSAPQLPVSILVIAAFLAGMLIGPAIGLYIASQKVRAYRRRPASSG